MPGILAVMGGKKFASFARGARLDASLSAVDALDRQIVAILQAEGRITLTELADRVHLSVSRCQRRVRELEANGTIRGYTAVVDAAALGYGFEVLMFATLGRPDALDEFDAALADIPQVVEAQRLFGEPDYLIRVVSADLPSYQHLYETVLVRLPGVRSLTSTIVMKQAVSPRPLPSGPPGTLLAD
jgi:DNA-binding Lrp family transcriptional regulator